MVAFASVSDLEAGWRTLTPAEATHADAQLDKASRMIRALAKGIDARIAADLIDPDLVADIVCTMVKREMTAPSDLENVSATNQQAGPFGQTLSFANPSGGLYLSKAEKKLLGIGGQQAFTIDPTPPVDPVVIESL